MYRIPKAWHSDTVPATLDTSAAVVQMFGRHMIYGRAVTMLTVNGVDSDSVDLPFTSGRTVSTRAVCRAIRAVRPV